MRLQCTGGTVQTLLPDAPSESYDSDCSSSFSFASFCRAVAFHFLFCTISEMNFGISLVPPAPLHLSRSSLNPLASHLTSTTNERALLSPWPHSFLPFPFPLSFAFPWWCCANCTLTPNSSERFQQSRANLQREIT